MEGGHGVGCKVPLLDANNGMLPSGMHSVRHLMRPSLHPGDQILSGMIINLVIGLLCFTGFVLWRDK